MGNIFDLFRKIGTKTAAQETLPITGLVVCLGNPGREYEATRHNAGFMTADRLAARLGARFDKAKFHALVADVTKGNKRFLMMKPQTYMNNSGEAVREAASFYKIAPEQILVISDDVSLDVGKVRIRRKGSDGGQKGLRSVIAELGSDAFPRIRVGVGQKPRPDYDMVDWVLGKIPENERPAFDEALEKACEAALLVVDGELERAMNLYN